MVSFLKCVFNIVETGQHIQFCCQLFFFFVLHIISQAVFLRHILNGYVMSHRSGTEEFEVRDERSDFKDCLGKVAPLFPPQRKHLHLRWVDARVTNTSLPLPQPGPQHHTRRLTECWCTPVPGNSDRLPTLPPGSTPLPPNSELTGKFGAQLGVWRTRKSIRILNPCRAMKKSFSSVRFWRRQENWDLQWSD